MRIQNIRTRVDGPSVAMVLTKKAQALDHWCDMSKPDQGIVIQLLERVKSVNFKLKQLNVACSFILWKYAVADEVLISWKINLMNDQCA